MVPAMTEAHIDWAFILRVAADAACDPRTVAAELAAERGERVHVRGMVGERVRAALARHRKAKAA